jgi:hypothetical protein
MLSWREFGDVSFWLKNQQNPKKALGMSNEAWFTILDLAEEYGWNPLGTIQPGGWLETGLGGNGYLVDDPEDWDTSYNTRADETRLVLLEDALNLGEALERAFLEYEPEPEVVGEVFASAALLAPLNWSRPSIGTITAVMDFCRLGAFLIEKI